MMPDLPSVSVGDVTVTEGNAGTTDATFTVSLSAATALTVTVNFATADGHGRGARGLHGRGPARGRSPPG